MIAVEQLTKDYGAVRAVDGAWVFERLLEALLGTAAFLPYSLLGAFVQDELLAGAALTVIAAAAVLAATSTLTRRDLL